MLRSVLDIFNKWMGRSQLIVSEVCLENFLFFFFNFSFEKYFATTFFFFLTTVVYKVGLQPFLGLLAVEKL